MFLPKAEYKNSIQVMKPDYYKRTTCRVCGSSELEVAYPMVDTPVGDDYRKGADCDRRPHPLFPVDPVYCRQCSLFQISGVVNPGLLYGNYIYETSVSLGLPDHFKLYAKQVLEKLNLAPGSLLVDIGCNDGTLLRAFREHGLSVVGVDPATAIATRVKLEFDIDVEVAVFDPTVAKRIASKHGKARLITANNVMANIDDLGEFAASIDELLDIDGVFVLETAYSLDIVKNCIFDNVYHEHLSYFSLKSLNEYFDLHGFQLFDFEKIATKGGSIRCYVQRKKGSRSLALTLQSHLKEEENFGLYNGIAFRQMGERLAATRKQLVQLLSSLKNEGKKIAGYGASVGATTVIYEFGLEKFLDCVFDDNPAKFDTFSPGHKIPIFSSNRIHERKIDYILILAWMYSAPIVSRNQEFVRNGGTFLTFLPKVKSL